MAGLKLGPFGLGNVGLEAAKRAERRLGPALGLRSYRALLSADDSAVVREALRGALRCALVLDDPSLLEELAADWPRCGDTLAMAVALCRELLVRGRGEAARRLADDEANRSESARAWYLSARVRQALGDPEAELAFERAAELAGDVRADEPIARSARAALLRRALDAGSPVELADAEIPATGDDAHRLLSAVAALRSSSRFRRASGLSTLAELAPGPLGRRAVAFAAEHADTMGLGLTWVEAERVAAVLAAASWLGDETRERAQRRLTARQQLAAAAPEQREELLATALAGERGGGRHLDLVRAVARGDAVDADQLAIAAGVPAPAAHALVAVEALRRDDHPVAARALSALIDDPGEPAVAGAFAAALQATPVAEHRERAARLVERLLATGGSPPRGWLPLAEVLREVGAFEMADRVLQRASEAGEPLATEALIRQLVQAGWRAHDRGDRGEAIARLTEAKRLATGSKR